MLVQMIQTVESKLSSQLHVIKYVGDFIMQLSRWDLVTESSTSTTNWKSTRMKTKIKFFNGFLIIHFID